MLVSHIMSNDESLLTTQRQECNVRNENNNRYNVVKTKKGKGPGYDDRYRDEDWTDDEEDGVD